MTTSDVALPGPYDPRTAAFLTFHDQREKFLAGEDTPRAYLERCIERLALEDQIKAFVHLDLDGARTAADASTGRHAAGAPLSPIDGLPIGMKDVVETEDLPTEFGSEIFKGWTAPMDAAIVYWLRKSGAYVLGKTVTTEFAADPPGPTRNPWNLDRTPGGSSSGSAAAVAARILPAATGTQVRGSVLRPAAYCGVYAVKPSLGTINLEGVSPISRSINHLGILAGSLADAWIITRHLSVTAGGEPGQLPIEGPADLPEPQKPAAVILLETPGWAQAPDSSKTELINWTERLANTGIVVLDKSNSAPVAAFEDAISTIVQLSNTLRGWENRYPSHHYLDNNADKLRPTTRERLENTPQVTLDEYKVAHAACLALRERYAALQDIAQICVTLNAPGPAPEGMGTGDPVFGDANSVIGVPALNLPLLADEGMPLGVQVTGFYRQDAGLLAIGRWLVENT